MITKLHIYESPYVDPYQNLAIEKRIMDTTPEGVCVLYLWQNQNTVVIGRNQNAWLECRTTLLAEEGGVLARRLSGGGAVFHDLGNLNFTFIMRKEDYDLDKQLSVIQTACNFAGIVAEKSGRNDLLASGRKFSGNAFYQNQTHAYHHGTLMVDVEMDKLGRYLSPPKAKLAAKGVASVRSRVINLKELAPNLTIAAMKQHMTDAFCKVYGMQANSIVLNDDDMAAIHSLRTEYASWDYIFGAPLSFTFQCDAHFDWGNIQIQLSAKDGMIQAVKFYSDSMDWTISEIIQTALTGCRFEINAMNDKLKNSALSTEICNDLCKLLEDQSL